MGSVSQDFNWVKARAACSLSEVFLALRLGIEQDVEAINALRGLGPNDKFAVQIAPAGNVFLAYRCDYAEHSVRFSLGQEVIEIMDGFTVQKLSITLTLNDEGRCKLKIGGEELEQWQVRRRALEALFFSYSKR